MNAEISKTTAKALHFKTEGDKAMAEKRFDDAIALYSEAIAIDKNKGPALHRMCEHDASIQASEVITIEYIS